VNNLDADPRPEQPVLLRARASGVQLAGAP
jgi:hypothetical protein